MLPINFVIDTIVILIIMKCLKLDNIKILYGKTILKVWLFGFVADIIGAGFLLLLGLAPFGDIFDNLYWNPYSNIYAILVILIALLLSGYFIYLFNKKYCFKKIDIEESKKKKIALFMAIFTAPYVFLIPTSYFYSNQDLKPIEKDYINILEDNN